MIARISNMTVVAAATVLAACGSDSEPPAENAAERQSLLVSVTDEVILPAYQRLALATGDLVSAAQAYADAVGTADEATARDAALQAFETAYLRMQYAEVLQVGPYGSASKFDNGQNLRDQVYSWPDAGAIPCQIDTRLVEQDYAEDNFFDVFSVDVYGFDALEYLLGYDSFANSCAAPAKINAEGTWAALSEQEITQRRADYAVRVATGIDGNADQLVAAWTSGFADQLRTAGAGSSAYRTSQAGLDALFASIFYIEKTVKDRKLAVPLGISPDCSRDTCPEALESQFAGLSLPAIGANLTAFRDIYLGGPDAAGDRRFGFDGLLRASGATQLADDMQAAMNTAVSRAPLNVEPVGDVVITVPPRDLHDAVKGLTDILKSQFVSVLALRVPNEGAADND